MKINGSLVFDSSSASEVQNLRLQKVTTIPGIVASDVGRLIYNTNSNIIHVGTNINGTLAWVPLATGGDASALLAEVERIETALGLNNDGSFNADAFTGNLAGQTSYIGLITTLQGLAAANATAIGTEASRATAAEAALGTRIDDVESDATAESTRLEGLVTTERERAVGEEGRIEGLVTAETSRATAAEAALDTRIDNINTDSGVESTRLEGLITTERTQRIAADDALDGRIDDEATARASADTALGTRIDGEATARAETDSALDGRITTEVADRTTAVDEVAGDLADEITRATTAETALGGRIDAEVTDRSTAISNLRSEMNSALVGLTWEAPVDLIAADATTVDLTGLANGYRIVDMTTDTIFTVTDGALGAGEALVSGAAFFNRTNSTGYVFNGTEVVPFNGAAAITAGNGLVTTNNRVDVVSTSGTLTVTEDSVDVAQSVLTSISDNATAIGAERTRAETAEIGLGQRITDETTARADAISAEATERDAAILVETNRATAAEEALDFRIVALEDSADSVQAVVETAVNVERDRALAAEAALGTRIDGEVTARDAAIAAAEGRVAALAATETTRVNNAIAAEAAARDAAILVETERATAAEEAIGGRIDKMYFLYDGAPATSHAVSHNLGQRYCNVTVVDSDDNVVIPESIVFTGDNALTVTFNTAIACRVVVMGLAAPAV